MAPRLNINPWYRNGPPIKRNSSALDTPPDDPVPYWFNENLYGDNLGAGDEPSFKEAWGRGPIDYSGSKTVFNVDAPFGQRVRTLAQLPIDIGQHVYKGMRNFPLAPGGNVIRQVLDPYLSGEYKTPEYKAYQAAQKSASIKLVNYDQNAWIASGLSGMPFGGYVDKEILQDAGLNASEMAAVERAGREQQQLFGSLLMASLNVPVPSEQFLRQGFLGAVKKAKDLPVLASDAYRLIGDMREKSEHMIKAVQAIAFPQAAQDGMAFLYDKGRMDPQELRVWAETAENNGVPNQIMAGVLRFLRLAKTGNKPSVLDHNFEALGEREQLQAAKTDANRANTALNSVGIGSIEELEQLLKRFDLVDKSLSDIRIMKQEGGEFGDVPIFQSPLIDFVNRYPDLFPDMRTQRQFPSAASPFIQQHLSKWFPFYKVAHGPDPELRLDTEGNIVGLHPLVTTGSIAEQDPHFYTLGPQGTALAEFVNKGRDIYTVDPLQLGLYAGAGDMGEKNLYAKNWGTSKEGLPVMYDVDEASVGTYGPSVGIGLYSGAEHELRFTAKVKEQMQKLVAWFQSMGYLEGQIPGLREEFEHLRQYPVYKPLFEGGKHGEGILSEKHPGYQPSILPKILKDDAAILDKVGFSVGGEIGRTYMGLEIPTLEEYKEMIRFASGPVPSAWSVGPFPSMGLAELEAEAGPALVAEPRSSELRAIAEEYFADEPGGEGGAPPVVDENFVVEINQAGLPDFDISPTEIERAMALGEGIFGKGFLDEIRAAGGDELAALVHGIQGLEKAGFGEGKDRGTETSNESRQKGWDEAFPEGREAQEALEETAEWQRAHLPPEEWWHPDLVAEAEGQGWLRDESSSTPSPAIPLPPASPQDKPVPDLRDALAVFARGRGSGRLRYAVKTFVREMGAGGALGARAGFNPTEPHVLWERAWLDAGAAIMERKHEEFKAWREYQRQIRKRYPAPAKQGDLIPVEELEVTDRPVNPALLQEHPHLQEWNRAQRLEVELQRWLDDQRRKKLER